MKNIDVIRSFMNNKYCQSKSMWTNGIVLYSYGLQIGFTENGKKCVYDYTASGNYRSNTTSRHVKKALREGAIQTPTP